MRQSLNEIENLIKIGLPCIWVTTFESKEFIEDMTDLVSDKCREFNLYSWSNSGGLLRVETFFDEANKEAPNLKLREPMAILEHISGIIGLRGDQEPSNNIFILKDFNDFLTMDKIPSYFKEINEGNRCEGTNIVICTSGTVNIPESISRFFRVVDYGYPEEEDIRKLVCAVNDKLKYYIEKGNNNYVSVTEEIIDEAVKALSGITYREASMALAESFTKENTISPKHLLNSKIQIIKKSGLLDYKIPETTLEDIGGNRAIKKWLYEEKEFFSEEAREFNIPAPKGAVFTGVAGCAKTAIAEAFAGMMNMPFISFNPAKIMSKLVGESEQKIEQALNIVRKCAPCVLLVDEIEKAINGNTAASARTDGGVGNRIMASFLKFMQDNDNGVFVIMTSNDITMLPPEFTRSGRIDAQWFFDLPKKEERREIASIYLKKINKSSDKATLDYIVSKTDGYTGAEIKEVIYTCLRKDFLRYKDTKIKSDVFSEAIMSEAISEVIPISISSKEKIIALQNWSIGRARNTDIIPDKKNDISKESFKANVEKGFGNIFSL